MKRICIILMAAAMMPTFAMAQKRIKNAVEQFKRSQYAEISITKETDVDDDGKKCVYEVYAYEVPKNAGKFKQLVDAFDNDQADAYSVMKRMQGRSSDGARSIGYGRNASKSVSFGNYSDRNYYLLLFSDPQDSLRRTCYELTWYETKETKKKDVWQVYITHIYSIDPQRRDKRLNSLDRLDRLDGTTTTTTTTTTTPSVSTTLTSDGTIIRYDRSNGNTMVYKPQKNNTGSTTSITTATDFIMRFNDLRLEYVKAIEWAGKEQTFYGDMIAKPVKELLTMCRTYHKLLSVNEQNSCCTMLDEMKQKSRDRGIQEMLELSRKYLRGQ